MLCALVASTDLEKTLDATKEVTRGAGMPSAKMVGRPGMACGQSIPHDEGRSPPARQGSPYIRGRGMCSARALSPRSMIGKEHQSVTPTCPTTGILAPSKVTIRHQLVVPSSSSDDDLPLVKHDAWVDLNPDGTRICYTQEHALMSNSPPPSPPPYIMLGQWVGVGRGEVLIPNLEYKGKGHTKSASSNPTPRVQRHHHPPKIYSPPRMMEFTNDDMEEKEELSNELVASLKQKINALEERVAELHLAVYYQQDDFGVLRKATTSKLKHFTKALGDPSLYNAPSP
jgi:hypothetical protein